MIRCFDDFHSKVRFSCLLIILSILCQLLYAESSFLTVAEGVCSDNCANVESLFAIILGESVVFGECEWIDDDCSVI